MCYNQVSFLDFFIGGSAVVKSSVRKDAGACGYYGSDGAMAIGFDAAEIPFPTKKTGLPLIGAPFRCGNVFASSGANPPGSETVCCKYIVYIKGTVSQK